MQLNGPRTFKNAFSHQVPAVYALVYQVNCSLIHFGPWVALADAFIWTRCTRIWIWISLEMHSCILQGNFQPKSR